MNLKKATIAYEKITMSSNGYIEWKSLPGWTLDGHSILFATFTGYGVRIPYTALFVPFTKYLSGTPDATITNLIVAFWYTE